jgi:GcrA cell cycle regulator
MHLVKCEGPKPSLSTGAIPPPVSRPPTADDFRPREFFRRRPVFEPVERVQLRCVEVDPRHVLLVDLKRGDCRYPYGGDEEGEPITFCGHPRRKGSSYCTPHFHLTRDPALPAERAVSAAPLRLVDAV